MRNRRTAVHLPHEVVLEIDKIAGARHRSEFLADLARREIRRQHLLNVFQNPEPIWKDEDHPDIDDSAAWIKQMRAESEARLEKAFSNPPND